MIGTGNNFRPTTGSACAGMLGGYTVFGDGDERACPGGPRSALAPRRRSCRLAHAKAGSPGAAQQGIQGGHRRTAAVTTRCRTDTGGFRSVRIGTLAAGKRVDDLLSSAASPTGHTTGAGVADAKMCNVPTNCPGFHPSLYRTMMLRFSRYGSHSLKVHRGTSAFHPPGQRTKGKHPP